MQQIILSVNKSDVIDEVGRTTHYTGARMENEPEAAFARISTTVSDNEELERFWEEAKGEAVLAFKTQVGMERETDGNWQLTLDVSSAFDPVLAPSMESGLKSYFVLSISAKWFAYTNKGEASDYYARAKSSLEEVREKSFYKKCPKRPTYQ